MFRSLAAGKLGQSREALKCYEVKVPCLFCKYMYNDADTIIVIHLNRRVKVSQTLSGLEINMQPRRQTAANTNA